MNTINVNGTNTAELTISEVVRSVTENIDLTDVLDGSLKTLIIENNVAITISSTQIENITTIDNSAGGAIITDAAGGLLLGSMGVVGYSIDGGNFTLEDAITNDLAAEDSFTYTMDVDAEAGYDALYLGANSVNGQGDNNGTAADQLQSAGSPSGQAVINITGTVTVAQATALEATNNVSDETYALTDTAANIAGYIGSVDAEKITSITITDDCTALQAVTILAGVTTAIAAVIDVDDVVLVKPTYTISDTAGAVANYLLNGTAAQKTIIAGAESVTFSSDTLEVDEAAAVVAQISDILVGGYDLNDDTDDLYGASTAVRDGATDITVSNASSVPHASRIDGYNNSGDTTYSLSDNVASLYSASTTLLVSATTVTPSTSTYSVAQLEKLSTYISDATNVTLQDTATNLSSDTALELLETFGTVTITSTTDLTIAQAVAIETKVAVLEAADAVAYTQTITQYAISDTTENLIATLGETETDTFGNNEIATDDATTAIAAFDSASNIEITTNMTVAQATELNTLVTLDIHNVATVDYTLSDTVAEIAGAKDYAEGADDITFTTNATVEQFETLVDYPYDNTTANAFTFDITVEDTLAEISTAVTADKALLAEATLVVTNNNVSVAQAALIADLNEELGTDLPYTIVGTYTELIANTTTDTVANTSITYATLYSNATNVILEDTAAEISAFDNSSVADTILAYAKVDSYNVLIETDAKDNGARLLTGDDPTTTYSDYYDAAGSVNIFSTDTDTHNDNNSNDADSTTLSVAQAITDRTTIGSDNEDKVTFAELSDTAANLVAAAADEDETAVVGQALEVTISDAVSVEDATTIAGLVDGTLMIADSITDTAANLVAAPASLYDAVKEGAGLIIIDGTATVAQYQAIVDAMQTAEIIPEVLVDDSALNDGDSTTELTSNIVDTITNVQDASVELLSTLGDSTNKITLAAGSEVSLTVAQLTALDKADNGTNPTTLDDILASDDTVEATYEVVDTIENIINAMTNSTVVGSALDDASTIIATEGVTVPAAYLTHLTLLAQNANFDTVNSVYSIEATQAQIAASYGSNDTAVSNATSVVITDDVDVTEALAVIAKNENVTFDSLEDDFANIFDLDDGLAESIKETVSDAMLCAKAGNNVVITDATITVEEATAIVNLLGDTNTVTYVLSDTAENLAAAGDLLANASGITATGQSTVAEANAISEGATWTSTDDAGVVTTATVTYSVTDSAANLAVASQATYNGATAIAITADATATAAEALAIETLANDADTDGDGVADGIAVNIDILDTAANVVASIEDLQDNAESAFDATANDTITLTTTVTMAQADALSTYTIDTAADVAGTDTTDLDAIYIADTAANLLDSTLAGGYTNHAQVTVTDAINVSKAVQIKDDSLLTLAEMTYDIEDTQVLTIVAFDEDNDVLGAANSITVTDVGSIEVYKVDGATEYNIVGSAEELTALPAELLEVGYIIKDSVANYNNAVDLSVADGYRSHIIVDESANVLSASSSITGAAAEVQITDTIDVTAFNDLTALGLDLSSVAGLSDTLENVLTVTLNDVDSNNDGVSDNGTAQLNIATVTIEDESITIAEAESVTLNAETTMVYTISDVSTAIDFTSTSVNKDTYDTAANLSHADFANATTLENAQSVTIDGDLTVDEAGISYGWNSNTTMTIKDDTIELAVLWADENTPVDTMAEENQLAAINAATTVSLNAGQTVTVEQAVALTAVAGFDGVYTLLDDADNLAAADASILSSAVEVQVNTASKATVAEASVLSVLANIAEDGNGDADFVITDTAANLAAAEATLLDNVKEVNVKATADADNDATAAEATALATMIDNANINWSTTAYDIVDTQANIVDTANKDGVEHASLATVYVSDATTVTLASDVMNAATGAADYEFDISDIASEVQADPTTMVKAESLAITDDITAVKAGVVTGIATGVAAADLTFAKVTGTNAQLTTTIVGQATTVAVTDTMTMDELDGATGFIAKAGDKLVDGYELEDTVDNIVNGALNNDFSAAIATGAADVTLTGDTVVNVAESEVLNTLNFDGSYDLVDTATAISTASADLVNNSTTTTVQMVAGTGETFDATTYTENVTINLSTNAFTVTDPDNNDKIDIDGIDKITVKNVASATDSGDVVQLLTTTADYVAYDSSDDDFLETVLDAADSNYTAIYGYVSGTEFVVSDSIIEDTLLVYSADAVLHAVLLVGQTDIAGVSISDGTTVITDGNYTVAMAKTLLADSSTTDTLNVVDTGANIATLTTTELEDTELDSIDANDNAIAMSFDQVDAMHLAILADNNDVLTITDTAADLTAQTIADGTYYAGAGNTGNIVNVTALQSTEAADLSSITVTTHTASVTSSNTSFTGDIGDAEVTVDSGATWTIGLGATVNTGTAVATGTITGAAAELTTMTISGTVAVTALEATLDADLSSLTSTTLTAATGTLNGTTTSFVGDLGAAAITVTGTDTTGDIFNVDGATTGTASFTVTDAILQGTAAKLTDLTVTGNGNVEVTGYDGADADSIDGIDVSGTLTITLADTGITIDATTNISTTGAVVINGGAGIDNITGTAGSDTINLTADTAVDTIIASVAGTSTTDIITDFLADQASDNGDVIDVTTHAVVTDAAQTDKVVELGDVDGASYTITDGIISFIDENIAVGGDDTVIVVDTADLAAITTAITDIASNEALAVYFDSTGDGSADSAYVVSEHAGGVEAVILTGVTGAKLAASDTDGAIVIA